MDRHLQGVAPGIAFGIWPQLVRQLGSAGHAAVRRDQRLQEIERPALRLDSIGEALTVDHQFEPAQGADAYRIAPSIRIRRVLEDRGATGEAARNNTRLLCDRST